MTVSRLASSFAEIGRSCGAAALALALAVGISGCSGTPGPSMRVDTSYLPVTRAQLFASMVGMATGDQQRTVDISIIIEQEKAKGRCMREAGFEYSDARPEMLVDFAPQTSTHDPAFAEHFGLGVTAMAYGGLEENPNDRVKISLSNAESARWSEREIECDQAAQKAIDVRVGELESMQRLADEAATMARVDPAVLEAQAQWRTCMTERGVQFSGASYWDLFDHFVHLAAEPQTDMAELARSERVAAIASAACDGDQWEIYRSAVTRAVSSLSPEMYELTEEFR